MRVEYDFCIKKNDECFHIMGTALAHPKNTTLAICEDIEVFVTIL